MTAVNIVIQILAALSSGAGGGLIGGVFALFRQAQERAERVEIEKIKLERERMEYANDRLEREHAALMLDKKILAESEKTNTENEIALDVANQKTLSKSLSDEFKNLKTDETINNIRAIIRPYIAVWATVLFTIILSWAFYEYHGLLSNDQYKSILLGLLSTLEFVVSSVITYYYVARRNTPPTVS